LFFAHSLAAAITLSPAASSVFNPPMPAASLARIVSHCDQLLRSPIQDYDGAENGLQVENGGQVTRVAAAVDASLATVRRAVAAKADLLVVHHGLFWSKSHPWTGRRHELLRWLLDHDLAVYSSHLPLDAHPRLGNNALLFSALGLRQAKPFFHERGGALGLQCTASLQRDELVRRMTNVLHCAPTLLPGGPTVCRRIGVVTGGAGSQLRLAAAEGVDTFVTGEGPHWTFALAEDLGVNVLYGGHYATETFGVKALAAEISRRFKVPWEFIDHPSGL
jgi:dinuclear metal center YbgI/SA1388 family protein